MKTAQDLPNLKSLLRQFWLNRLQMLDESVMDP
jgi:hypothetical protein